MKRTPFTAQVIIQPLRERAPTLAKPTPAPVMTLPPRWLTLRNEVRGEFARYGVVP